MSASTADNPPPSPTLEAERELRNWCELAADSPKGCLDVVLCSAALQVGGLVQAGRLDRAHALRELMKAAKLCGFVAEHGKAEARWLIQAALGAKVTG